MARWYRAPNKRLSARGGGGRFRPTTLADIGLATCETCGGFFAPDLSKLQDNGFIDPRDVREAQRVCPECKEGSRNGK